MSKKDYSKLDKADLLKVIEKLESRKKYGLIWDEENVREQFEKDSENALPVLKEIKNRNIVGNVDDPVNILIEGDNYHALSVLNFTHQGKIDVIYIDPPYNRGSKDFIYNDKYVDNDDTFKHSKWISFMEKRLRLAKKLLSEDGVIYVSIDDNEVATLKLIMDSMFNHISTIHWRRTEGQDNLTKNISVVAEYIFVYGNKKKEKYIFNKFPLSDRALKEYRYEDNFGKFRRKTLVDKQRGKHFFEVKTPKGTIINGPFNISEEKFKTLEKKDIYWASEIMPYLKTYITKDNGYYPNNWFDNSVGTNEDGTDDLTQILGRNKFDHPKPVSLIQILIKMAPKNRIVLDFFAGSGTTGHAVLELNKVDNGNRNFILCTNNENNICEEVTYPRIKKIIEGYETIKGKKVDGLGGNLKYFKTKFIKNASNKDDFKIRITQECTEMLCLRESIFNEIKITKDYRIFQQGNRILAIYYSLEQDSMEKLRNDLDNLKGKKVFYCFTLDPIGINKNDFIGLNDITIEPIPQKILDIYKHIYEY